MSVNDLRHPDILGTGLQRYDSLDQDTAGAKNTLAVFHNEIWPNIKKHFVNKQHVVDVGCGNGRHSAIFSDVCENVTAIDPFREINSINARKNIRFIKSKIQDFIPDTEVDLLYLHGVFYLMDNWSAESAFLKMKSILKSGGIIVIADDKKRNINANPPWVPGFYNLGYLCEKNNCEIIDDFVVPSGMLRVTVIEKV